jgi:acyl-CoA thioesterase-1
VLFYPFFLEGVAAQSHLNQRDGIHPTAEGVDVIVRGILPYAEKLIAEAQSNRKQ